MRKSLKVVTVLLALLLALQFFSAAAPAAFADGGASDTAAVGWLVRVPDSEGNMQSVDSAEALEALTGPGFALSFGKDAPSEPTVAALRSGGLKITPPEGYALSSVFLCAEGAEPESGSRSLLSLASADLSGGAVTLPKRIFLDGFDASSVGAVFNGPQDAEKWIVRIELAAVQARALDYTPGTLTELPALILADLGDGTPLAAGGDHVSFDGAVSVAALSDGVEALALDQLSKVFDGWRLVCDNGASALVKPGDQISLRSSATLSAQWKTAVVFSFGNGEKLYDGTPLVASYSASPVLSGDTLNVPDSALSSQTAAGEAEATLDVSAVTVTRGGEDVTDEYSFRVVPGRLRVIQRSVTFKVADANAPYSGQPLVPSSFSVSFGELVAGHEAIPEYDGSRTLPGTSADAGTARFTIRDGGGNDVSASYNVSVQPGSITVSVRENKQPLTVTMHDAEKEYDGTTAVSRDKVAYELSGDLLGSDELFFVSASSSFSGIGEGELRGSFAVKNGETDVTDNYAISVVPGRLTITQRAITLTADSAEKDNDGTPLTLDSFSYPPEALLSGHSVSATVRGSQTEKGSSENAIVPGSVRITDADGKSVIAFYNVTLVSGTLTVKGDPPAPPATAIEITVSAEKPYDGSSAIPLELLKYTLSGTLAEGDRLVPLSAEGSITSVGVGSVSSASFAVKNGENDVTANYAITVKPGKLTVKARAVTLTAASDSKNYDGTPLKAESFTVAPADALLTGHKITATVKGSQTEIGSSDNVIDAASVKVTDAGGKDVTALYSAKLVAGRLTVNSPSDLTALTIKMKDVKKVYDGKALSSKDYEIVSGKLIGDDKLEIKSVSGEQTEAGESSVTAVFSVKRGKTDVTALYSITVNSGKLTVEQRPITVQAATASKIYDGRPLTRDQYSISSGELVKGHKLTASVTGSQTDIGSSANMIVKNSVKITDAANKDVTGNYNVTTAAGTLTVSRDPVTPITLSVGDNSKVYDGKPYRFLGSDLRVVAGGPLPSGCKIEATFNPEAPVDAGKYDVTIKSVTIRNASGADITGQFNITRAKGSLTITQRPLTIETKAANKVYDGTALTERSTPNITGRMEEHQVTLRITGSQTKVGTSENTVSDVKITDKATGADVTKNYAITYQYGLLTVNASDKAETAYTWIKGSAGTLYIKLDHAYDGFEGLQVDGKDLARSSYTSASGSTDVWLKADYLNTLSAGTHSVLAKYSSGETAKASFTVKATQSTRTGDSNNLTLWIVLLLLALLGTLAGSYLLYLGKKGGRRWKKRPVGKK